MENRAFLIGMVPVEDTSMGNRALFDKTSTLTIENRALLIKNEEKIGLF